MKEQAVMMTYMADEFILQVPFNDKFNTVFKETVPFICREWNKKKKVWIVKMDWYDAVKSLVKNFYGGVYIHKTLIEVAREYEAICSEGFDALESSDL